MGYLDEKLRHEAEERKRAMTRQPVDETKPPYCRDRNYDPYYGDECELKDMLIEAFDVVEKTSNRLQWEKNMFNQLISDSPTLRQLWDDFQQAGGITADELKDFMRGKMKPRNVRRKKHLRLVYRRRGVPRIKLISMDDDDAA